MMSPPCVVQGGQPGRRRFGWIRRRIVGRTDGCAWRRGVRRIGPPPSIAELGGRALGRVPCAIGSRGLWFVRLRSVRDVVHGSNGPFRPMCDRRGARGKDRDLASRRAHHTQGKPGPAAASHAAHLSTQCAAQDATMVQGALTHVTLIASRRSGTPFEVTVKMTENAPTFIHALVMAPFPAASSATGLAMAGLCEFVARANYGIKLGTSTPRAFVVCPRPLSPGSCCRVLRHQGARA